MLTSRALVPPTPDVAPRLRPTRRRPVLALGLAGASVAGLMTADRVVVADAPPTVHPQRRDAPSIRTCDHLWDQILVLGLPEQAWPSVADHFGFAQSQDWLSADGLTWEHLDGRLVTVATPRRAPGDDCAPLEQPIDRTAP